MNRRIHPEILDQLPQDHPDALRNRRDIVLMNRMMGNYRWLRKVLAACCTRNEPILELGAGTGELGRFLWRAIPDMRRSTYVGLDLMPRPAVWPDGWEWHRGDLLAFDSYGDFPVVIAHFILHQFDGQRLAGLGKRMGRTARVIVACETARRRLHILQLYLVYLAGINHVSRHDARVSIEAGFLGRELPCLLGLHENRWRAACRTSFLGRYSMVAERIH